MHGIDDNPGIYLLKNIVNGKVYIGSSKNVLTRIKRHLYSLKTNRHHNYHLQNSYDKHGSDCFIYKVVEYCKLNQLRAKEREYINKLKSSDSQYGYNKITFTESGVIHHSKDSLKKISKSRKAAYKMLSKADWDTLRQKYKDGHAKVPKEVKSRIAKQRWVNRDINERQSAMKKLRDLAYKKTKKPVQCSNGLVFESLNDAARYFKVRHFTIQQSIKSGRISKKLGISFKYIKEPSNGR